MKNAFERKTVAEAVSKKLPRNFTKHDLEALLSHCGCTNGQGGRGSGIRFFHRESGRIIAFDEPHPENELYPYQIKMVRRFVTEIGEYKGD